MLTIFLVSILCIFNTQSYKQQEDDIKSNLMRVNDTREKGSNQFGQNSKQGDENNRLVNEVPNILIPGTNSVHEENQSQEIPSDIPENNELDEENEVNRNDLPIFMDTVAYTAFYNSDDEITDVINHTQNNVSDDEIKEIAENILKENIATKQNINIGNLYFTKYSFSFSEHNSITIIDNSKAKASLLELLKTSVIIFFFLEIVIVILSLEITKWIIKPVIESFNKQKQFVADASHELKTPIAVIMANAEALENEPNEKKWLDNIKSESERMNDLITDLLDLAKLENATSKEEIQIENLSKIVEKTLLTFESLIYEKHIKLEYDIGNDINIKCNSNQMKQLIAILLDNAIQHSEENGEISVSLNLEKNEAVLRVKNKGKEIPKEIQTKIFERFYRADESRNRDQNRYGLGLAIAKSIVNNHNGKIFVKSSEGYTTFIAKLSLV